MAASRFSNSLLPPVVRTLLIANGLMFLLELAYGEPLITALALWPLDAAGSLPGEPVQAHFRLLQLVSYSFLHGSVMHLFLNMYALWLFGARMENVWGSVAFTVYYFVCVIGAALVQLLVSTMSGDYYPTVGASGGVFGLLLAFGLRFPNEVLLLVFPPVALPAKWFVTIYAGIELLAGITGTEAGVAHFAHLGGMLFGYLLIRYWRRHPPGLR
ncbi:MAG: rhomboid family intramembrane serine protease [Gammaproteobacteria bacterium]|jgi:membrane associated rhomboid family serine protease